MTPNWSELGDAYGPAEDVPGLLAQLSPDPQAAVWQELWSRLCHQGTVYSASFAALPSLADAAARWASNKRAMVLDLAGAIVASKDVVGSREQLLRGLEPTLTRLAELARESLAHPSFSQTDFIYLLQSARAFVGDHLWGQQLEHLADSEFPGLCPGCGRNLFIVIGEEGSFTAAEEWLNRPETPRTEIEPSANELPPTGLWLRQQALAAGQAQVADWIRYLFGTGRCPSCNRPFAIADAIEAA